MASERNKEVLNIKGVIKNKDFSIRNVYNSGQGKPSKSARAFKSLMGI